MDGKARPRQRTMQRRLATLSTYALLLVLACMVLIPFTYLVCASLKGTEDAFTSTFFPAGNGSLSPGRPAPRASRR